MNDLGLIVLAYAAHRRTALLKWLLGVYPLLGLVQANRTEVLALVQSGDLLESHAGVAVYNQLRLRLGLMLDLIRHDLRVAFEVLPLLLEFVEFLQTALEFTFKELNFLLRLEHFSHVRSLSRLTPVRTLVACLMSAVQLSLKPLVMQGLEGFERSSLRQRLVMRMRLMGHHHLMEGLSGLWRLLLLIQVILVSVLYILQRLIR